VARHAPVQQPIVGDQAPVLPLRPLRRRSSPGSLAGDAEQWSIDARQAAVPGVDRDGSLPGPSPPS